MAFPARVRWLLLGAAAVLGAACWALVTDPDGPVRPVLERSHGTFGSLGPKAALSLLVFPAAALLGAAAFATLSRASQSVVRQLEAFSPREVRIAVLSVGCLAFGVARMLVMLVSREQPVSDHELVARFGGQLLSLGRFTVPTPPFFHLAFPRTLLHEAGGKLAGSEWLGVELAWAVGTFLRSGAVVFAFAVGLSMAAMAVAAGGWLGRRYAPVAILVFGSSPLFLASAAVGDGHVLLRGAIAVATALVMLSIRAAGNEGEGAPLSSSEAQPSGGPFLGRTPRAMAALLGLSVGFALITRPVTALGYFVPAAWVLMRSGTPVPLLGTRSLRATAAVAAVVPVLALLAQQHAVTGHFWLPARWSSGLVPRVPLEFEDAWQPLRELVGMAALWLWGPLALALVVAGSLGSRVGRALGAGAVGIALASLVDPVRALSQAGPLALTAAGFPLGLLITRGLLVLTGAARVRFPASFARFAGGSPLIPITFAFVVSALAFASWDLLELRRAQFVHEKMTLFFERRDLPRSVVLVPPYDVFRRSFDDFRNQESTITDWRRPSPDLSERALVLEDGRVPPERLRTAFPKRRILRLHRVDRPDRAESGMSILPESIAVDPRQNFMR